MEGRSQIRGGACDSLEYGSQTFRQAVNQNAFLYFSRRSISHKKLRWEEYYALLWDRRLGYEQRNTDRLCGVFTTVRTNRLAKVPSGVRQKNVNNYAWG